jgi:hypothetical protein
MDKDRSGDEEFGFNQDMDRIQTGYDMLNSIEQKLKSYLGQGDRGSLNENESASK